VQSDRERGLSALPNEGHQKVALLRDATIVDVSRLRGSYQIVGCDLSFLYMSRGKRG